MDADVFRRQLRRVLVRVIPLAAAAGSLAGLGCDQTALVTPQDGIVAEGQRSQGERIVFDTQRREWVQDGVPPVRDGAPLQDGGKQGPGVPLPGFTPNTNIHCPFDRSLDNSLECNESREGNYQLILPDSLPGPLSFEECSDICRGQVDAVCATDRDSFTHFSPNILRCEEKKVEGLRLLDCDFRVQKGCTVAGRRPHGLCEDEVLAQLPSGVERGRYEAGLFFAELAYLEEAAVTAFSYLAEELKAYEAPVEFIALAEGAIAEEVEHAALMRQLAHRYGATPRPVEVAPFVLRPLAEIAFENAREGCVRESYGALMAMWQSLFAEDKAVRVVMERIAFEESQHAALSWAINDWAAPQLSAQEREQLAAEHKAGHAELLAAVAEEPSPGLAQYAGYPSVAQAISLLDGLQAQTLS